MAWPDVHAALYSALDNDAPLTTHIGSKIFANKANEGAAMPYLIFNGAMGLSPNIVPRATLNHVYRIESRSKLAGTAVGIIDGQDHAGAQLLHSAVYDALHGKRLTISGWTSWWMMCEDEHKFTPTISGKDYFRFVWDVRIRASEDG